MLMRSHFYFFGLNIEGKLLNCIGCLFLCLQLHVASDFVIIDYLYLFHNALRIFGGNQRTEVENSLIHKEHIGLYHTFDLIGLSLILQNELLFKDILKALSVDARNARLSYQLVFDAVWLI